MPRDNQTKMSKKELSKSSKKKEELRKKKSNEDSSSSDNDSFYTEDEDEDEMDVNEYRKFLSKIFPSKHLDNKIKSHDRLKQVLAKEINEEDSEEEVEDNKKNVVTKNNMTLRNKNKQSNVSKNKEKEGNKKKQPKIEESEEEDSDSEYLGTEDSESESSFESDSQEDTKHKTGKFNIIFTIGGRSEEEDEETLDDEDWETCSGDDSEVETENENDPISSDSDSENDNESVSSSENNKKSTKSKSDKLKSNKNTKQKQSTRKHVDNNNDKNETMINNLKDVLGIKPSEKEETDIISVLKSIQTNGKNNELISECIKVCEEKLASNKKKQDKMIKKEKSRNERIFKRIIRDKNTMNDFEFYKKLDIEQQKKILKELRDINSITRVEKPYRLTLLDSDIPVIFKATAMKKLGSLRHMEPGSGEYYKIKNWVDTFMRIPFNNYNTLPIKIEDGVDVCHEFMANAQKTLDDAVYGLNDAKMQIMQMVGQLITNPVSIGTSIAICGPPGTGKTSLVKEGISKILNRPFAFIALGGATDSSFLEGHSYTYEGSIWGKIVQILIDSKCMNPVIYFDELDKISDTPKGEEIAGILTHLTDTSQNSQFHDKYFAEIDFDLSKCLFIFSYNDESKVNPILKDRMYRIQTKGYNQKQKTIISNSYLLPKIREQVKFEERDIIIPEQTLHYIIENHCNKEDGVRNLKRCLEIIYTKLNLYRLMRPGSNLFEEDMSLKVEFPFTVTKDVVDKMIKKTEGLNPSLYYMYI
jgi:ATP-dependent Lon protease